jgi:exosortase D (VPLPA-CTERM-specific)
MGIAIQSAPPPLETLETKDRPSSRMAHWQAVTLLLLVAGLYASVLFHLFLQWVGPHSDPNFQHGIFVPLFALYVLWQDRGKLKAIAPAPSWTGLPLVLLSLVMMVMGELGADIFLPRVSLLILLAGLIILFQGWKFFRALLFPWAFLILMIPIPNLIISQVTFPLQLLAAKLATSLLQLVIVVHREGNVIFTVNGPLDVVEACSGIRSLLSLVTLAIIYGYLMETRNWVRVVLACAAVPIAVATNGFRVFVTGLLVQYGYRDEAEGTPHALTGLLIFAFALVMLFAIHRLISLIWKSVPAARHETIVEQPASENRMEFSPLRFGIVAVPLLATAIALQFHSSAEIIPSYELLSSLPSKIDGWTGTDVTLSPEELDILGHPEYVMRDYENARQPQPSINFYIAYFPSQKAGDTIHSPEHCLPGAGWIPTSREVIRLTRPDGSSFPVNRYVVSQAGERQLVLYWFQAHGRAVASAWQAKYYLVDDSIHMNRSDGGLVRLMTYMSDGESPDAAQARMMKLGSHFLPLLDNYIPH